eukprot:7268585-Pyramimonas_sp.AAC.1
MQFMKKSSIDAMHNLIMSEQHMRKWIENKEGSRARMRFAAGGQTFPNQQPGTALTWVPDRAVAQPPARYEP